MASPVFVPSLLAECQSAGKAMLRGLSEVVQLAKADWTGVS